MTKPEPSAPRCEHREHLASDLESEDGEATGPRCEGVATYIHCVDMQEVCEKHRCRCKWALKVEPPSSAPLDVGARAPTDVDRRLDEVRARLREPRHYTGNDAFRARDFNDALFLLALVDELRRR